MVNIQNTPLVEKAGNVFTVVPGIIITKSIADF